METTSYLQLIQELCAHVGIESWGTVSDMQHIELDGATVGLLHDESSAPGKLAVFFDLGMVNDRDAPQRLLEDNSFFEHAATGGYFALLPQKESVIYRVDVPLACRISGADLAAQLITFLETGRRRLRAALAPDRAGFAGNASAARVKKLLPAAP